ncbi:carboxylesterase family protein [Undibacterium arcticum]
MAAAARSQFNGAMHASELPFVFDTLNARYGASVTPQDAQTAKLANDYWVSFAKTGNPNGIGRPEWQAYDTKSDTLLEFFSRWRRKKREACRMPGKHG